MKRDLIGSLCIARRIASRAVQVALGCYQLQSARETTARWRELEPWSGDAALAAALVALKRYDLKEARAALQAWRDSGSAGSQDPLQFAAALSQEADATALYRVFADVLVGEDPTAEVMLAQARLAHVLAIVSLYQALGGGWSPKPLEAADAR